MNYEEPAPVEREETPEEYLDRMTKENAKPEENQDEINVSDFSDDDLLV